MSKDERFAHEKMMVRYYVMRLFKYRDIEHELQYYTDDPSFGDSLLGPLGEEWVYRGINGGYSCFAGSEAKWLDQKGFVPGILAPDTFSLLPPVQPLVAWTSPENYVGWTVHHDGGVHSVFASIKGERVDWPVRPPWAIEAGDDITVETQGLIGAALRVERGGRLVERYVLADGALVPGKLHGTVDTVTPYVR